jgi:hypothetical protein
MMKRQINTNAKEKIIFAVKEAKARKISDHK